MTLVEAERQERMDKALEIAQATQPADDESDEDDDPADDDNAPADDEE
jgi:hypothetical protein